jgi:uncharacterized protein YecE (DUF72 family)
MAASWGEDTCAVIVGATNAVRRMSYLHGRTVAERFDYDYPVAELEEIAERATQLAELATEVHVLYNNNKGDYALRAAARTQQVLAAPCMHILIKSRPRASLRALRVPKHPGGSMTRPRP